MTPHSDLTRLLIFVAVAGVAIGALIVARGNLAARLMLAGLAIAIPFWSGFLVGRGAPIGGLSEDGVGWLLVIVWAMGWTCLGFYPSQRRAVKWTLFAIYPIFAFTVFAFVSLFANPRSLVGQHILGGVAGRLDLS